MYKGSKELEIHAGATVTIRSSGSFCAFGMEGKNRTLILGPIDSTARTLRYKLPDDIGKIYVKTEKSTEWTCDWQYYNRQEVLDNTPVEMPVGYDHPESLADQMRRFIRDEVSASRNIDQGSFEEEDDFDEDEELLTEYELSDMQEVEEIDWDENTNPAEQSPIVEDDAKPEPTPATEEKTVDSTP